MKLVVPHGLSTPVADYSDEVTNATPGTTDSSVSTGTSAETSSASLPGQPDGGGESTENESAVGDGGGTAETVQPSPRPEE